METLGEYLKNRRLSRDITLEEVAKVTKIRKAILKAIEDNSHDLLPHRVFTQGFIKIYASYLELDESEVLKRYQDDLEGTQINGAKGESESQKPPKKVLFATKNLVLVAVFVLALAFWFFVLPQGEKEVFVPKSSQQKSVSKPAESFPVVSPITSEEKGEESVDDEERKLEILEEGKEERDVEEVEEIEEIKEIEEIEEIGEGEEVEKVEVEEKLLKVVSNEITWIEFRLDNDEPFEVLLRSGESFKVKAHEKFNLRIGNAGGVELFLNGEALGNPGKRGEVVDITLPE